ncbi:hypothetical protein ACWDGI_24050 [Streptomyces sp. NPDC001220]
MSGRSDGSADETGASRLRRFQERVESTATRVLLVGVFVTGLTAQGDRDMPVDDPDFRKRMEQRCREYDGILSELAERLTEAGRVRVECEYRLYPGIPRDKICIFNRQQVLHGLYDLSVRMRLNHLSDEYYDPKGYRTDLNVWSREGAAEEAVATWTKHFDDLWFLAKRPHWRQETAA